MVVNLFSQIRPIGRQFPMHKFCLADARKLAQQAADPGKLLTGSGQRTHFALAQLRLSRQLRTNQRHDPTIPTQAQRSRTLFDRAQFRSGQSDFDATARLSDDRPGQTRDNRAGFPIHIVADGNCDQLANALARRQTAACAPVVPAQPDCPEFDTQTLAYNHD
ncbi:hypothetical protein [Burkholderia cepacia]|uniref:hypothetical protein n=1 Tax=Burkholderia cepacia TaxID=292 RepID=UPI0012D9EF21